MTKRKKKDKTVVKDEKKTKGRADHLKGHWIKPGQVLNPKGRPKGSRTAFAETFLKDFIADWEEHGADAITTVRKEKPAEYLKVAASLLPKDINLNLTNEAQLEKLLDKYSDEELDAILRRAVSIGAHDKQDQVKAQTRTGPDSVH